MKIVVHNEVKTQVFREVGIDWQLCFQQCTWKMEDGRGDLDGYRFMWRGDGRLRTQRGQARIHDAKQLVDLLQKSAEQGWFTEARSPAPRATN